MEMKKVFGIVLAIVFILSITSCTKNQRVKTWGGEATFELPANEKLVLVTWKEDELWYLTRPMTADDKVETYKFQEKSSWGMLEGTYILKEVRK